MFLREDYPVGNEGFVMEGLGAPYVTAQCYKRPAQWWMDMHAHRFYQLIFITDGDLHAVCDNGEFDIGPGQVHIAPPGFRHMLSTVNGFRQLGVDICDDDNTRELVPLLKTYLSEPVSVDCPDLLTIIQEISERNFLGNRISRARIASYLDSLVLRTLETHTQEGAQRFDKRLSSYINERLHQKLSLQEIADRFHMSVPHLERMTRKHFNNSVIELHNLRRLERGRILLEASEGSITEIAEQLGFHDTAHFSSFFRQKMGIPPTTYRQMIRQAHQRENSKEAVQ